MTVTLPAVRRDEYSAPFFDAATRGELVAPQCVNGHYSAPTQGRNDPVARCHECGSDELHWSAVTGNASLVSWTVLHGREADSPTKTVGIVELDEGPWLRALITADPDVGLRAGLPMGLDFVKTGDGDGEVIPAFYPRGER